MKTITALLLAAMTLAACEPSAAQKERMNEQKERMKRALPDGCTITDLGAYGSFDHVLMVFCDGRPTRTFNSTWTSGGKNRVTHYIAQVQIGE